MKIIRFSYNVYIIPIEWNGKNTENEIQLIPWNNVNLSVLKWLKYFGLEFSNTNRKKKTILEFQIKTVNRNSIRIDNFWETTHRRLFTNKPNERFFNEIDIWWPDEWRKTRTFVDYFLVTEIDFNQKQCLFKTIFSFSYSNAQPRKQCSMYGGFFPWHRLPAR